MTQLVFHQAAADVGNWIVAHADAYRVRPDGVLRELLQNATDAITQAIRSTANTPRFIEVAILSQENELPPGQFHLVIRDSAEGISHGDFDYVRVMGRTSKTDDPQAIGQFGVGIYSVHAAITPETASSSANGDFVLLSQKQGQPELAVRYDPIKFGWWELDADQSSRLRMADFLAHPRDSRRRPHGTSIYLRISPGMLMHCHSWLSGPNLAVTIARDCLLLPHPIYVADYSRSPHGAEIRLPVRKTDVRDLPINLPSLPWAVDGAERDASSRKLLEALSPYTDIDDLPDEFISVSRNVDNGHIDLFLYVHEADRGNIDLYLKNMWVEAAPDVTAPCTTFANACVNIAPSKPSFDINLPMTRERLYRNDAFRRARREIQSILVEAVAALSKKLLARVHQAIAAHTHHPENLFRQVEEVLNGSTLYTRLCRQRDLYGGFLSDIPDVLLDVLNSDGLGAGSEVPNAIIAHYKQAHDFELEKAEITEFLRKAKEKARIQADQQEQSQDLHPLHWTPATTRQYLRQVGPFLPVTLYRRPGEDQPPASHTLPLAAIQSIEPSTVEHGVYVLANGRVDALFRKERTLNVVVVPRRPAELLILVAVSQLTGEFPLRFVSVTKELFIEPVTPDEWLGIIELFEKQVLSGQHQQLAGGPVISVVAKGFNTDIVDRRLVPLVRHSDDRKELLVVNVYNQLMQQLNYAHNRARMLDDRQSLRIIASICHELYHHAQPAEFEGAAEDKHCVEVRNAVFEDIVSLLRQYSDLQRQA